MDLIAQLYEPAGVENPYPIYHALRERDPVCWAPYPGGNGGRWLVTGYDWGDRVLKDSRIWKDASRMGYEDPSLFGRSMLFLDPPDHTRLRGLVNRAFTPAMVARLGPRIGEIVEWLCDDMAERGRVDFIRDFALPLPVVVIAEILGVPVNDRNLFREWSRTLIAGTDVAASVSGEGDFAGDAIGQLAGYFDQLIRMKRDRSGEDLLSALIALEDGGDRLSHQELLAMCVLLLVAGHETTVNLLGNGLFALMEHPDQLEHLRQHPDGIESAVEEMLRFDAPVQETTFRFVGEPLNLGGHPLEAGQSVVVLIGAANRDPAQFPDPDRFDVTRSPNRHLAFGRGIHVCLGAPVARLEAGLAWSLLIPRFRRIALEGEPRRRSNLMFRGFDSLPAVFQP